MEDFPVLATHQSLAVVSIGPLSLLILFHAIISCEDFWQIECIDNNFRPLLTSKLQFKIKVGIIKPIVLESVVTSFENLLYTIIEKKGNHFEKYYC